MNWKRVSLTWGTASSQKLYSDLDVWDRWQEASISFWLGAVALGAGSMIIILVLSGSWPLALWPGRSRVDQLGQPALKNNSNLHQWFGAEFLSGNPLHMWNHTTARYVQLPNSAAHSSTNSVLHVLELKLHQSLYFCKVVKVCRTVSKTANFFLNFHICK